MTVGDAVKIHGISERTIRRWIKEGRIGAVLKQGVLHVDPLQIERAAEVSKRERHARSARPQVPCYLRTAPVDLSTVENYRKFSGTGTLRLPRLR